MTRLSRSPRAYMAGLAVTLALAAPAMAQDETAPDAQAATEAAPMTKGEKELAKLLEGREAGEPVACIRALPSQRIRTIDKTAYVYGSGTTIYVQRTRNPQDIDRRNTLVTQRFNASEICKLDVMSAVDPISGIFAGVVFFEDFVPYTLVKDRKSQGG